MRRGSNDPNDHTRMRTKEQIRHEGMHRLDLGEKMSFSEETWGICSEDYKEFRYSNVAGLNSQTNCEKVVRETGRGRFFSLNNCP